jgi:hypothetical protein
MSVHRPRSKARSAHARGCRGLYRIDVKAAQGAITGDKVAAIKAEYAKLGGMRAMRATATSLV